MAVNTTVSTQGTTYLNKTFYDRNLLENAKTQLVHAQFGQKRSIPKGSGKKVEFRKWTEFDPLLALNPNGDGVYMGLTEGVTPEGMDLKQTNVEAECKQYGAYVEVSDLLKTSSFDDVMEGATDMLGEQMGIAIEWVTRAAMNAGTNVQYANGKNGRSELTAADALTVLEVRKAVRTLKKNKAKMISGKGKKPHFVCICSPDSTFDLQNDALWQDVSKYSNAEQIYSGEIGRLFGVVFVESTEAMVFAGKGNSGADVHSTLIFGKDAYGTVDIAGSGAIETIIKPLGSGGTEDPLNQRATVGAKVPAYTAVILNNGWMVRVEHGVTA
ncbi:MAG: N4-gp56 family major capsid protein [Selenomonadales bacterium]|nr:N4-gp56 family major capsid protein [Selenomonadales bacterium]